MAGPIFEQMPGITRFPSSTFHPRVHWNKPNTVITVITVNATRETWRHEGLGVDWSRQSSKFDVPHDTSNIMFNFMCPTKNLILISSLLWLETRYLSVEFH